MNRESEQYISSIHPAIKSGDVRVLYTAKVQEVLKSNELINKIFVISSCGIFLTHKKSFGGAQVDDFMSFYDIVSINIAGKQCSFSSNGKQIRIKSDKISKLASYVYHVRTTQFPLTLFPCNFHITNDQKPGISLEVNIYKSKMILAERITSCAFHYGIDIDSNEMKLFYKYPPLRYNRYMIIPQLFSLKMCQAIILGLSYEQNLHELVISQCRLSDVFDRCGTIFNDNLELQKVVFDECDFADAVPAFHRMLGSKKFLPTEVSFSNCNGATQDFLSFFEALSDKCNNITSLVFDGTKMNSKSLNSVFQTIFFNDCFHHLETLELNSVGEFDDLELQIGSLAGCSWAITSKCIRTLYVTGCNFDASSMLMKVLNFDIGLHDIHLSNNKFISRIPFNIPPKTSPFLDISYCQCRIQAISSLIEAFATGIIDVYGLDLSSLKMYKPEEIQMLALMSSDVVVWPHLETFFFDNNKIDVEETLLLSQFIKHQPNLKRVSLNCSIDITESFSGLQGLLDVLAEKPLEELYLRGDETLDFSYGQLLIPFLRKFVEKKTLKVLDISNQKIGSEGIKILRSLLATGIEEIHFDGINASDFNELSSFVRELLKSDLVYASWPHNEYERVLAMPCEASANKVVYESEEKMLHVSFIDHFGFYCDETPRTISHLHKNRCRSTVRPALKEEETNPMKSSAKKADRDKYEKLHLNYRDPDILNTMTQIINVDIDSDPLINIISSIDKSLNLETLINNVRDSE